MVRVDELVTALRLELLFLMAYLGFQFWSDASNQLVKHQKVAFPFPRALAPVEYGTTLHSTHKGMQAPQVRYLSIVQNCAQPVHSSSRWVGWALVMGLALLGSMGS